MRLVHEPADGESRMLATDVERADSLFAKASAAVPPAGTGERYNREAHTVAG